MFGRSRGVVNLVALLVHPMTNACLTGEVRLIKPVLMSIAAPVDNDGQSVSAITHNAHVLVCVMVL